MQRNLISSLIPSEWQILDGSGRVKNIKHEGKSLSFQYSPKLHVHTLYLPLLNTYHFFPKLSQTFITFYTSSFQCPILSLVHFIFKILFTYLFLEREEGREKERERNINLWLHLAHSLLGSWPATQECALDWKSNW